MNNSMVTKKTILTSVCLWIFLLSVSLSNAEMNCNYIKEGMNEEQLTEDCQDCREIAEDYLHKQQTNLIPLATRPMLFSRIKYKKKLREAETRSEEMFNECMNKKGYRLP